MMNYQNDILPRETYTAIEDTEVKIYLDNEIAENENPDSIIWNQPLDCDFDESILLDQAKRIIIKRHKAEYDDILEKLSLSAKSEMERIRKETGIISRGYHVPAGWYIKNEVIKS
jgi:hypothetical protein